MGSKVGKTLTGNRPIYFAAALVPKKMEALPGLTWTKWAYDPVSWTRV